MMKNKVEERHFLITGMARSGTTLLEKILNSHVEISVLSQPMPWIYRLYKNEFLNLINVEKSPYPLNSLFNERSYCQDDILDFLHKFEISKQKILEVLRDMQGWSGQKTNLKIKDFDYQLPERLSLAEMYRILLNLHNAGKSLRGSKEIIIEEFVEYFLSTGTIVIIILRDPRDVITSINEGEGAKFAGDHRPTLFHLRNWRKSVAIANTFSSHPNFMFLKYEDLVQRTDNTLDHLTNFLKVSKFTPDYFSEGIKDNSGKEWKGNSSMDAQKGINSNNTEKYLNFLNKDLIDYINYICEPEMRFLGYLTGEPSNFPQNFSEQYEIKRTDLNSLMSTSIEELKLEELRRSLLTCANPDAEEVKKFFVSETNYKILSNNFKDYGTHILQ